MSGCKSDFPAGTDSEAKEKSTIAAIDRHALVSRHDIATRQIDPMGALAVGNGGFAFNVDVTGLQSFPEFYEKTMPIGILSDWGWHAFRTGRIQAGQVSVHDGQEARPGICLSRREHQQSAARRGLPARQSASFRAGPIGLEMTKADGSKAAIEDVKNPEQKLDLWGGEF